MTKPFEVVPINKADNEELILRLETALEEAKSGELASIFYVKIRPNGNWVPSWAGKAQDRLLMIGMLEALKWELLNVAEEESK